ncbi:MAG: hypothetical protein IPL50_15365 [Chitinophagaceae bacterium]|nr:hypothetical protein [Chitinophagaceae bacterium]
MSIPSGKKGFFILQDSTKPLYGHGFVNFSIKPIQTAITLDTIGARAAIVFDFNDTIATNIHTNTIDAFAPTSHMNVLPPNSTNPFTLSWTGMDDTGGCGIVIIPFMYLLTRLITVCLYPGSAAMTLH